MSNDATAPAVAMDASGNAAMIWHQDPEGTVRAARRSAIGPWEPPTLLDTQTRAPFRRAPTRGVAMDAAGDAVTVWRRLDGSVWASWSAPGAPWTAPVRLTDSGEVGLDPSVALDPAGDGFAVWQTGRPSEARRETRIRVRRVSRGRWEPAQDIQLALAEEGGSPQVALGSDGTAVAVWYELRSGVYRIWANRYRPGVGWGTAEPISRDQSHEGAIFPDVGADALGNAVAAWVRFPGGPLREIEARRFDAARGWGPVATVATGRPYPEFPRVAVDASGSALAVWLETPGSRGYEVWAASFAPVPGWGPAQRLQSPSTAAADSPGVAVDTRGNGVAAWRRDDGDRRVIWAARFRSASQWGGSEPIGVAPASGPAPGPVAIAVSPGGDAVVAWEQWDGTRFAIWANRFAATERQ